MSKRENTTNGISQDTLQVNTQLFSDSRLDGDFTDKVMSEIRTAEFSPAAGTRLSTVSGLHRNRYMKKTLLWGSAAVAVMAVAASLLFLPSPAPEPSLPAPSQRMLLKASQWQALDLLKARTLGVIQQPDIQISDQGYTLLLQEVVADPVRLVLNIRITDSKGLPATDAMSRFDYSQVQLLNESGQSIGMLKGVFPVENQTAAGKTRQDSMLLTYIFPDEEPGDQVLIQGNVHELTADSHNNKTLSGDWSFSYEADLSKAKQLSVTTDLEDEYNSPDGLKINMEQITRSPAGIRLDFTTVLTGESAVQVPMRNSDEFGVMYHLETSEGEVLSRVNSAKNGLDNSFGYTMKAGDQAGEIRWSYFFPGFPEDSQPVRFVLEGYYYRYPLETGDSVTFDPQDLLHKPAVFNAQGDVLKVNAMEITEIPDEPGLSGWMSISGEFTNKFAHDKWIARDGDGNEYEVIFRGSFTQGEKVTFGETEDHANEAYFIVKGMTELPGELTLTRVIMHKNFTGVDWSFDLPANTLSTPES